MTVDRVREVKAWSGVLQACCEDYLADPSGYRTQVVMQAMRELAETMDKALTEELSLKAQ